MPTPFGVGDVNAYLIEDDPLTLIDSGPASTSSLAALERQLSELGYTVADLGLLLVTHQHVDHLGLTSHLAAASGAEIACLDQLATYALVFHDSAAADDAFAAELMSSHGVPEDTIAVLQRVAALSRHWGSAFTASRSVDSGSLINLRDRSLRVIHAPGHSPTDTLFFDETHGVLFAGDHLLAKISSNALISRDHSKTSTRDGNSRRQALLDYVASLRATQVLAAGVVLGGHGPPISAHRALIDDRLARYEQRAREILSIIREQPRSAHEIAEVIWGNVAVTQAFLTLSEVLGHVDLLMQDSLLIEEEDASGTHFFVAP